MDTYIDFILAGSAMPVLLRKKSACLLSFRPDKLASRRQLENRLSEVCRCFGTLYQYMYEGTTGIYTFIYQQELLEQRLRALTGHWILKAAGYPAVADTEIMLQHLGSRLSDYHCAGGEFPHEIGLFLGYPIRDVEAYIRYEGKFCRCQGYWKVYENEAQAKRVFRQYKRMQREALQFVRDGQDICEYESRHVVN